MSAQVRTRLRFRHLPAAAAEQADELEKVGPVRPLAPGALRSLQRRRWLWARGAPAPKTGHWSRRLPNSATLDHRHPYGMSPAPPQRPPPEKRSPWGLDGTEVPRTHGWSTSEMPPGTRPAGLCHGQANLPPVCSGVGETRPVSGNAPARV